MSSKEKCKFFLKFDVFADPITLTYKGENSHPTTAGGVVGLFYIFIVSSFLASRIANFFDRSSDHYY